MKVGQFQVVRWVSKLVGKPAQSSKQVRLTELRELDARQLRHVAGGDGGQSLPNKNW